MHENGATRLPIASSSADLLVIPFHTARQGGVNHGSNVWLIDPHSERRGCHHDIQLARHEFFLHSPPPLSIQSCMVAGCGKLFCQLRRQTFRLLACRSVDDGWPVFLLQQYLPSEPSPLRRQGFYNLDSDVLAAETMDEVRRLS